MPKDYSYRNLIVWKKAQELALLVLRIVERLPHSWGNAVIARQVIASATSMGANIAEGHGRYTPGAHRHHLSIAKGSAAETDSWLDLMRRSGILDEQEEALLHERCTEIMVMLTHKIRELEQLEARADARVREAQELYTTALPDQPATPYTDADYV
jgi:four helix bundle protein